MPASGGRSLGYSSEPAPCSKFEYLLAAATLLVAEMSSSCAASSAAAVLCIDTSPSVGAGLKFFLEIFIVFVSLEPPPPAGEGIHK